MTRAYDDEFEDPAPDALMGGASSESVRDLDHALLNVISALAQIHVLLGECDVVDFRRLGPRLRAMRALVEGLPSAPSDAPVAIGFKPKGKKR